MNIKPWLLILGANSDMAIATARVYAHKGYNLYLASRDTIGLELISDDITTRYQVEVVIFDFDAVDFDGHNAFYHSLIIKPQGFVLAFGVMHDQSESQSNFCFIKQMIDVNYCGAVSILEVIASDFERRGSGFIVGISSVAGDRGRMSNYLYGSTKAAFTTYLAGLRHRLIVSNVYVLTVKPGFVSTKMTEGLDLPKTLTALPREVGESIYRGVINKKTTIYVKPVWSLIMLMVTHIPTFLFHKTKL